MKAGDALIEMLELVGRLGRPGGVLLLLLSLGFATVSGALSADALPINSTLEIIFYSPGAWFFAGLFFVSGAYLVVTGGVWKRDDRFSPLTARQLGVAIENGAPPFCVCLDCMLFLPYEVSVGRCPRCKSAGSCLEVLDGDGRRTALNAIPTDR